jgi:5-phospho-D-xylono-1,4-lactonase
MSFIRTILGDIAPGQAGIVYSHEHIVIDHCYATSTNPDFLLNDFDKILTELLALKSHQVGLVVDTMPSNAGRNPMLSAELSRKSGIHQIVCSGIHLEKYYPSNHWRYDISEEKLSQLFIDDIEIGMDQHDYNGPAIVRTQHKAGLLKLATAETAFNKHQLQVFNALVNAHNTTGAPILTHTEGGKQALEQAELFIKLGADPAHIVLSHTDKLTDDGYQKAIFDTGVSVEWDSAFRWKAGQTNNTYRLLEKFLPLYPKQITVGMDAARNSYWKSYGGSPGLAYLRTTFLEELTKLGLDSFENKLFQDNPQRIFTFKNKTQ